VSKKAFTVRLSPDLVKALRIQAIKEERKANEVIEDAINRYLAQVNTVTNTVIKEEKIG